MHSLKYLKNLSDPYYLAFNQHKSNFALQVISTISDKSYHSYLRRNLVERSIFLSKRDVSSTKKPQQQENPTHHNPATSHLFKILLSEGKKRKWREANHFSSSPVKCCMTALFSNTALKIIKLFCAKHSKDLHHRYLFTCSQLHILKDISLQVRQELPVQFFNFKATFKTPGNCRGIYYTSIEIDAFT